MEIFAQSSSDVFEKMPSWEEHFNGKGYPNENDWTVSETYTKQHLAYYVKNPHNIYVKRGKLNLVLHKDSTDTKTYIPDVSFQNEHFLVENWNSVQNVRSVKANGMRSGCGMPRTKNAVGDRCCGTNRLLGQREIPVEFPFMGRIRR